MKYEHFRLVWLVLWLSIAALVIGSLGLGISIGMYLEKSAPPKVEAAP